MLIHWMAVLKQHVALWLLDKSGDFLRSQLTQLLLLNSLSFINSAEELRHAICCMHVLRNWGKCTKHK